VLEEFGQAFAEDKSKTNHKRYGVKDSFSWNGV
jgi:hypothetical protein